MSEGNGVRSLGWWVLHGETMMEYLYRAHAGEDPDVLVAEIYANSEHEDFGE